MESLDESPVEAQRIGNQVFHNQMPDSAFKADEGFSEDTRSLDDGDSTMGIEPRFDGSRAPVVNPLDALLSAIMALDEMQRSEHAYNVLRTLRTSSIAAIVERLRPLLHLDPVAKLPPDITSLLFSFLEPASLLQASLVSKAWRERTLDTLLWRDKFRREGWVLDMNEVFRFEREYKPSGLHKALLRKSAGYEAHRRRKRPARDSDVGRHGAERATNGPWSPTSRQNLASSNNEASGSRDDEMEDVESTGNADTNLASPLDRMETGGGIQSPGSMSVQTSRPDTPPGASVDQEMLSPTEMIKDPALITRNYSGGARVNFHHVYKQKRRLEENWLNGRFKSFQLPHKDHPEEAHSQCVYTIQYSGRYLVSGSRDKTLRIWDLDTQRLIRRPLEGHQGSVLCLQFDCSKDEDLVVSGSSDTDVILWQFSTGKLLRRISNAHRESVLNLKFDRRFLVTCSKDKMIKIWNRRELLPGDADYPMRGVSGGGRCPNFVLEADSLPPLVGIPRFIEEKQIQPIPAYSPIMKIDDHGAAVNAVHIYKDQLVSASGDRALRVFDIHSGVRIATCKGHNKGIACVQYDGKRIVSGSSDNTIRIFDPKSQAEVACLQGHNKLVRTVQAAFGDTPGAEEDMEQEARDADRAYFAAEVARRNRVERTSQAGRSRDPIIDQHSAIGAKLPPGGGGSPWARIISGSYDETVIIWKKGTDGRWKVAYTLKQADALQAAGGPLVAQTEREVTHGRQAMQARQVVAAAAVAAAQVQGQAVQPVAPPPQPAPAANVAGTNPGAAPVNAPGAAPQAPPAANPAMQAFLAQQTQHHTQQLQQHPALGQAQNAAAQQMAAQALQAQQHLATMQLQMAQAQPHGLLQQNAAFQQPQAQPNARVFKLQFDARRIICCSQDPKIVGWDFANGDEEIIECSRFFGSPI